MTTRDMLALPLNMVRFGCKFIFENITVGFSSARGAAGLALSTVYIRLA